eukprot:scaffold1541_cov418-Prasinococcus_capsulatus_cf.AAC.28
MAPCRKMQRSRPPGAQRISAAPSSVGWQIVRHDHCPIEYAIHPGCVTIALVCRAVSSDESASLLHKGPSGLKLYGCKAGGGL